MLTIQKKKATNTSRASQSDAESGYKATIDESIPQATARSNTKSSMRDEEYITAAESGNTEEAQRHEEARAMMQYAEEMQQIWDNALAGAVRNAEAGSGTETVGENVKYSYRGTRDDGVEVYETSAETRALSDSEKKKKYIQMMREQYSGRTAKFEHDGEVDYARFTGDDMRKDMYGDQRSDVRGQKAKLNVAADGDIFTLVENASYSGSEAEQGKDTKAHRNVISWDYYVKTVQIDGRMYDVLANIRKTADDSYVYSIQMNTRKTKEAALPRKAQSPEGKSFQKRARATSTESIPQSGEESNPKFSMRDTAYTTAVESGNTEDAQRLVDEAAEEALENSEARLTDRGEFRMGAGKLATVYHATYNDFTVFDRAKLGENTDAYASDESTAATAHLGFWFNTQPLSQSASYAGGKDVKAYLNAENIYNAHSLEQLTGEIEQQWDEELTPEENAEEYVDGLKAQGYDGIVLRDEEFGGTSFVVFDPEQIKSVEAITYDDAGNVIPLSERFNSRSNDIYLPDSGVEPGRDGRYEDMRPARYARESEPRYERTPYYYCEPRRIGFDRDPYARRYGSTRMGEDYGYGGNFDRGYGGYNEYDNSEGLSWEETKDWMMHLRDTDGKTGPHWNIDQTNKAYEKKKLDCEPHEYWAAMNMLYSDYGSVAKKFGVDNADFFACLAEAFLNDDDAIKDKLAAYYECIVKH